MGIQVPFAAKVIVRFYEAWLLLSLWLLKASITGYALPNTLSQRITSRQHLASPDKMDVSGQRLRKQYLVTLKRQAERKHIQLVLCDHQTQVTRLESSPPVDMHQVGIVK